VGTAGCEYGIRVKHSMTRSVRSDLIAIGLLLAVVAVLLVPALAGRLPMLRGDTLNDVLPRMVAIAREVQRGHVPLWDPHTFAGARLFYTDEAAILFYPVMWPFYAVADVENPFQCALLLVFVPFLLNQCFTALGAYLFSRLHLRLGREASFAAGLTWAWSPLVLLLLESVGDVFVFSYFPWGLLCLGEFLRTGGRRWWLGGTVAFALMNSVRGANYQIRIYFVAGIVTVLLWLLTRCRGERSPPGGTVASGAAGAEAPAPETACGHGAGQACAPPPEPRFRDLPERTPLRSGLGRLAGAIAMMLLGAALLGFAWAGIVEGIGWVKDAVPMTYRTASDLRPESSMPPIYAITLLIPGFFGVLDSHHAWGSALSEGVSNVSALGGGLLLMTAAVTAVVQLGRSMRFCTNRAATARQEPRPPTGRITACAAREGEAPAEPLSGKCADGAGETILRTWTLISLVLVIGGLVTMMGRYTPVFRWLCAVLPWFFRIPHAVYYRFAVCWGLVVLAAIGTAHWMAIPALKPARRLDRRIVLILIGIALAGAAIALVVPVTIPADTGQNVRVPACETLGWFRNWGWFFAYPVAGFGLAAFWALLTFVWRRGRTRAYWLLIGLCLERAIPAIILLYVSLTVVQRRAPGRTAALREQWRTRSLAGHAPYELARRLRSLPGTEAGRWTCVSAVADNQAWCTGQRALLGANAKPLLPGFRVLLDRFTKGAPYIPRIEAVPIHFFRNMNVAILAYRSGGTTPLETVAQSGPYTIARIDDPLPYVYTQDRILQVAEDEALRRLFETDARVAACVGAAPRLADALPSRGPGSVQDFNELQAANRVRVKHAAANRLAVHVEMRRPAMLVRNECWHPGWEAWVDGRRAPVLQINGLLQGVWLEAGHRHVEFRFSPPSMRVGWIVTLAACVLVGAVVLWPRRDR